MTESLKSNRPSNTRPPYAANYKELCALCRAGKLFAVEEWFKHNEYKEPERYDCKHWPMGIAIEMGFHSLVEVLLRNGVPADERALQQVCSFHKSDMVELMFDHGASVNMMEFEYVVDEGNIDIIRMFIERGADLITGYPIARGLTRLTRPFLGIYKSCIDQHPELQFQADMALRHFCNKGSARGISLLLWLGANPRATVPIEADDDEVFWETSLETAAYQGNVEIVKRLKPDPAKDDVNRLLMRSLSHADMAVVRYWISLGADINRAMDDSLSAHAKVIQRMEWSQYGFWSARSIADECQFAMEWFGSGAKWEPENENMRAIRKVLSKLSPNHAYDFIKLWVEKEVVPLDILGRILDTPKFKEHLKDRRAAVAALVPQLKKWKIS